MINLACIYALTDRRHITDGNLQFFLALLCNFDLRTFKALPGDKLAATSSWQARPYFDCRQNIRKLLTAGLLEMGPSFNGEPTFRIPPRYLLKGRELKNWLRDIEKRRQRETLIAEKVPAAPASDAVEL